MDDMYLIEKRLAEEESDLKYLKAQLKKEKDPVVRERLKGSIKLKQFSIAKAKKALET